MNCDTDRLEYLSVINRISIELSNHLGDELGNDKIVAEFIVSLFNQKKSLNEFMVILLLFICIVIISTTTK